MKKQKAKIINGKKIAKKIRKELKLCIEKMNQKPSLAIVLIGEDEASKIYVNLKKKACEKADIIINKYLIDHDAEEKVIIDTINFLNKDEDIHGIIVQLPLPAQFNENKIIKAINPKKDVDGFHPFNAFCLKKGKPNIIPGLAQSIINLLKSTKEKLKNKHAVIISNNSIFAEPIKYLLKKEKIQSKYISPKDKKIQEKTLKADIIIVAVGKANFIKKSWVKKDAIIIDVGINRLKSGEITGDVDPQVINNASWITPVPGGVGPMTVAMLLYNTYLLAKKDPRNL